MKRFSAALLAGLAVAVVACDDGSGPGDGACDAVTPLSIDGAGNPPNITWTPECGVARVEVIRLDNDGAGPDTDETVWRIQSSTNSINPTIQYGVAPAGTTRSTRSNTARPPRRTVTEHSSSRPAPEGGSARSPYTVGGSPASSSNRSAAVSSSTASRSSLMAGVPSRGEYRKV